MTEPAAARSRRPLAIAAALLLLLAVGGGAAYVLVLRGDEVAPLALSSPTPSAVAVGSASAPADGLPSPSSGPASPGVALDPASLAGRWTVGAGSVVGYRVREKLANLPAQSDAVGRTESVTGEAALSADGAGLSVTTASFQADLTSLRSDRSMRDERLRTMGIESSRFPAAAFTLGAPVAVPAAALDGSILDLTLHGDLNLHGVTRTVDVPAQARLAGGQIEVSGALTFPFTDFGMEPPNVGTFVSVEDDATLEFRILLSKSP